MQDFQNNNYFCFIDYTKAFDCVDHNKMWKILQEMAIPDHLTCLLRNLYAGQEATVRTGHGTTDSFQIGEGVCQGCILSPVYLTYMQSSVQFSSSDMSDSLRPHEPQQARPPCPSPTPGVLPNSCPLSWWCHPPSHPLSSPSPPTLNLSQYQDLFQWVRSSHQVAKVLEFQLQHLSFQWTPRTDLL